MPLFFQPATFRKTIRRGHVLLGFVILGLGLLIAVLIDSGKAMQRMQRQAQTIKTTQTPLDAMIGLTDPPYRDKEGLFSIVPPRGWKRLNPPASDPYQVVFEGPHGMDLSIRVDRNAGESLDDYVKALQRIERGLDARMRIETIAFGNRPAVKREFRLYQSKLFVIDFLEGPYAHEIQFAAPPEMYDEWLPAMWDLMLTYTPWTNALPATVVDLVEPLNPELVTDVMPSQPSANALLERGASPSLHTEESGP